MYAGTGTLRSVTLVERIERRMGLVDEMGGRVPAWRVTYDDRFSTRLYFDPASGEFLRARNDAWVLYDFSGARTSWTTAVARISTTRSCASSRRWH